MLNYLGLSVTPLKLMAGGVELSSATGYFYSRGGEAWLISNWHVFAGRDPRTGQPRNDMGAIPNAVVAWFPREIDQRTGHYEWDAVTLPLVADDNALWYQHAVLGQGVDVAALRLGSDPRWLALTLNSQRDFYDPLTVNMGEEVFVLGFPLGIEPVGKFALWKRASIATFPTAEIFGKPAFLIDTATREGMSGSPVIFPEKQIYAMDYGGMRIGNGRYKIIGTYSGRFEAKDELVVKT